MSTPRARCPYCFRRVGMTHHLQCPAMRLGRIVRLPLPAPDPPAPLLPATSTTHAPPGTPRPRPWQGDLRHDPATDWGFIRDAAGELVAIVRRRLTESEEHQARQEHRDPTQDRVDFIIAACNAPFTTKEFLAAEVHDLKAQLAAEQAKHAQDVKELHERLEKRTMDHEVATCRASLRLTELDVQNKALRQQIARLAAALAAGS